MTWREVKLGWVAGTIVPQRDKPEDLSGPIPWLRIEDFDGKYLSQSKSGQGVSAEAVAQMPLRVFPVGTVVCSCSCTMGATAIASVPLITNQTFIGLVPGPEVTSDFLYYLLQSMQDELQRKASGSIQQYLSKDEFKALRFSLPPIEEQRRIADFLDDQVGRIDQAIELRRVQIVIATNLVEDQVRVDLDSLRESAPVLPLRRCLQRIQTGSTPSERATELGQGIKWYSPASIGNGGELGNPVRNLNPNTSHEEGITSFDAGSVLLVAIGATAGKVSRLDESASGNQQLTCLTPAPQLNRDYLYYILRAQRSMILGTAPYTTLPILNNETVNAIALPLPQMHIQLTYVESWSQTDVHCASIREWLEVQVGLLSDRKRSLITAAVTGQLDVTSARPIMELAA